MIISFFLILRIYFYFVDSEQWSSSDAAEDIFEQADTNRDGKYELRI